MSEEEHVAAARQGGGGPVQRVSGAVTAGREHYNIKRKWDAEEKQLSSN